MQAGHAQVTPAAAASNRRINFMTTVITYNRPPATAQKHIRIVGLHAPDFYLFTLLNVGNCRPSLLGCHAVTT